MSSIMTHPFHAIHSHGMVRVAAATPAASVGDALANADAVIAQAREAHARGVDLVVYPELCLTADALASFVFHAEICEDYWAPTPPSTAGALAGALICCNLSASNIVIGKARERAMLCAAQSARAICAYIYSAAGPGESTTDVAWD